MLKPVLKCVSSDAGDLCSCRGITFAEAKWIPPVSISSESYDNPPLALVCLVQMWWIGPISVCTSLSSVPPGAGERLLILHHVLDQTASSLRWKAPLSDVHNCLICGLAVLWFFWSNGVMCATKYGYDHDPDMIWYC